MSKGRGLIKVNHNMNFVISTRHIFTERGGSLVKFCSDDLRTLILVIRFSMTRGQFIYVRITSIKGKIIASWQGNNYLSNVPIKIHYYHSTSGEIMLPPFIYVFICV
jgi:hypothetical protein